MTPPLCAEVERLRAESAWLMEDLLRHTGATEAEVRECMQASVHKPVLGHRMGALLRRVFTAEDEIARLRAALSWQESRHGTQAEQEREEAEVAAEMDVIDAMSDEDVAAELREAGVDVEAGRERCEALVRVALERNRLRELLAEAEVATVNERAALVSLIRGRLDPLWSAIQAEPSDVGQAYMQGRREEAILILGVIERGAKREGVGAADAARGDS